MLVVSLLSIGFSSCRKKVTRGKTVEVSVKQFGAKGDGKTDDTQAIRSAISSLKDGQTLLFPKGAYRVSALSNKENILSFVNRDGITIRGEGAEIIVSANSFPVYNVIYLENCDEVVVKDLIIVGDRLNHDFKKMSGTHEFGYGIYFWAYNPDKRCSLKVNNCDISQMTGDAVVTKNGLSGGRILIEDCHFSYCRRQGLSILDSDTVLVKQTHINHIGSFDGINGTAPMAAIDVEPASGTKKVNYVEVIGCEFEDTDFASVVGFPEYFVMKNSKLEDISMRGTGRVVPGIIDSCVFYSEGDRMHYYSMGDIVVSNSSITVNGNASELFCKEMVNCSLSGIYNSKNDKYSLVTRSKATACKFTTVQITSSNSLQMDKQSGNVYEACYFLFYTSPKSVFQSCTFLKCKRAKPYNPQVSFDNCVLDEKLFEGKYMKSKIGANSL